ncbi:hypothetical protein POG09_13715 [Coprococcus comes]|uniref:hypothetical protein n=2 Tax=Coprococcus comes TaxID=410072 RepID=UPI00189C2599|nr:hypothetical protein [Coprococcus comes]MDC0786920.1 hypothetical protein [Coprococcus comes]MDC0790070.1 hypothetical protein [Coprococcus comes]MDC0793338.1 hypothetical protein [Coprococcus comes]MDC0796751.1 hypothetical protein [Coprococcus comes]
MKIVSGRTGSPHVTSQQFRQMLEGIIGQGSYIITSGENLKPELSSNNLLKIRSGMMAHHGCISCVDIGTYDEVTLTNGSQGMKRIDLIVNRYTRNAETEVENCSWKVIQGKPVASNPAVPVYTSGNLQNGDLVDECPAFEVHYDGINVTEVKSLLSVTDGLSGLSSNLTKANSKITTTNTNLAKTNTVLENRKPIIVDSTAQGTVNWDTNNFLKSGVTYAFVVTVSSNLNSENYKQEISCALNSVNMGNNGNYYKLTSTFMGKCSKGDKIHITSFKNGGSWTLFATRAIFIPVS